MDHASTSNGYNVMVSPPWTNTRRGRCRALSLKRVRLGARGRQSRATGSTATPTTVLRVVQWNAEGIQKKKPELSQDSGQKTVQDTLDKSTQPAIWRSDAAYALGTAVCEPTCTALVCHTRLTAHVKRAPKPQSMSCSPVPFSKKHGHSNGPMEPP
jgi:hypothetical protein